jgi:TRAP-type mannitol/chloroaromatic compound transport system substrate-binding protein
LLKAFATVSRDVVAEIGSRDALSKKIYQSYEQFRASIMDWTDISERAYLNNAVLLNRIRQWTLLARSGG